MAVRTATCSNRTKGAPANRSVRVIPVKPQKPRRISTDPECCVPEGIGLFSEHADFVEIDFEYDSADDRSPSSLGDHGDAESVDHCDTSGPGSVGVSIDCEDKVWTRTRP